MTKREWQNLNEALATEAQEAEAERRWAAAAACWVALADLREDEMGSPLRAAGGGMLEPSDVSTIPQTTCSANMRTFSVIHHEPE